MQDHSAAVTAGESKSTLFYGDDDTTVLGRRKGRVLGRTLHAMQ